MERKNINILDLLVVIVKWKKFLLLWGIIISVLTYLSIYFFVEEKFDSNALIISSSSEGYNPISSILGDFPAIGFGLGENSDFGMFTTLIYSRTMLDDVINKFNLVEVYEISKEDKDYLKKARKILKNSLRAEETDNGAYNIEIRTKDANLSANIVNYIVSRLNESLIKLNIKKSLENRKFLEKRLIEIRGKLKDKEDSLVIVQKQTGILEPEVQISSIFSIYADLEKKKMILEAEKNIYKNIYPENHAKINEFDIQINYYSEELNRLINEGSKDGIILSLDKLPQNVVKYLRLRRDIEINSKLLEYVLPLYEQAKFNEQKTVPILQVIDEAVPSPKKDFPPRVLLTLIITLTIMLFVLFFIFLKENSELQKSEQFQYIKKHLFKWN